MRTGKSRNNYNSRGFVIYSKLNFRIVALVQMTTIQIAFPEKHFGKVLKEIWMLYRQEASDLIFRYMAHRRTQNLGCDIHLLYIKSTGSLKASEQDSCYPAPF